MIRLLRLLLASLLLAALVPCEIASSGQDQALWHAGAPIRASSMAAGAHVAPANLVDGAWKGPGADLGGGGLHQGEELPADWESIYQWLHYRILKHSRELPSDFGQAWMLKFPMPYVHALGIFAQDRALAVYYALMAQATGRLFYFNRFTYLSNMAQSFGDGIVSLATRLVPFEYRWGHQWEYGYRAGWCFDAEFMGRPVWDAAGALSFDRTVFQAAVRRNMQGALQHLEKGMGYLPSELWPYGNVWKQADEGLEWASCVRENSKTYELEAERQKADELMNRYLIDALCLLPEGHKWYLDLAEEYELGRAKEHIEGFYATLYGKVEVETGGAREPAPGATVTIKAPRDDETWTATAGSNGAYRISKVLLHDECSPFTASAEYEGDKAEISFDGPLEEPNKSYAHNLDLLIRKRPTGWTGIFAAQYNKEYQYEHQLGEQGYSATEGTEDYSASATFTFTPGDIPGYYVCEGAPGGSFSSSMRRVERFYAMGQLASEHTYTCTCLGGFLMENPEEYQSSLYISGNTYDLAYILIGDGERDCVGEHRVWERYGGTQVYQTTTHCILDFWDCDARGTFQGNIISGQDSEEWEGGWVTCSWTFIR